MNRQRPVLIPQYLEQFSCIGSACEDSCCNGWRVTVDEATYKKYNRVRDTELTFTLKKKVTRNRSTPSADNFAKIKMEKDGNCPFLNGEKLCSIQLRLGEDYLSNTCATYPRTSHEVNGVMERSATVSCPEIARLALLNPEGISFNETLAPADTRFGTYNELNTSDRKYAQSSRKYLWELRIFTIQVLQNRTYTLNERLVLLAMFYQKATQLENAQSTDQLPQLIASYTSLIEDGSLQEDLRKIPAQTHLQMQLLKEMLDTRFLSGISNQRFRECYSDMMLGLGYITGNDLSELPVHYETVYKAFFAPFIAEHEYILENYLVNYVFKNLFPFVGLPTLYDNYVMLVVHYAMLKLLLIGVGAKHEGMTTELAIKVIQSYAKTFEHSQQFLRKLFDLLKENGYTEIPYMAILINN